MTSNSEATTVSLAYPKTVDGTQFAKLTMRRATVADRRIAKRAGEDQADQEIRLFANLCDVPEAVIDALDEVDYGLLQDAYVGFRKPAA